MSFLPRLMPFLIATGLPLAIVNCSSGDDDSSGTGGSAPSAGGSGATGGSSSAGQPSSGGSGGTGTGGSATGGTGGTGTGGSATGGTGGSATGGSGGKSMAGGGGMAGRGMAGGGGTPSSGGAATGGASSGGASSGGAAMGGASSGGASSGGMGGAHGGATGSGGASTGSFVIASNDVMDGAKFDVKFTCNGAMIGAGINPELHWSGSPAGAMSFAITFIDTTLGPDNSMGQHWAMYNIPGTVMEIAQGALTKTLMGDISMAKQATPLNNGFLAPCAASLKNGMDDNYEFTIYALSSASLTVTGTSVAGVLEALGVLNSSGKLTPAPTPNSAILGTAVLHAHAGLHGQ
jgi:phosphatidylethanolamine-binding protein (PEBP) family uncharacterized protein